MTRKPKKQDAAERIAFETPPKRLSDLRCDPSALPEPEAEDREDGEEPAPTGRRRKRRGTATAIVVGTAFEATVSRDLRRRLAHGQALAAIVIVPTAAWVTPVTAYVQSAFGPRWCFHTRDGADRRRDASVGSGEAARDLSKGLCVMGVSHDPKLLPASLQSAADVVVRIPPPTGAVLRRAIARFARRSPGELDPGIAAGLDLDELVAAFRPGRGAAKIADRIDAARRSRAGSTDRVPALSTAVEYGAAQRWGLQLARDIDDFRNHRLLSARDIDRGICLHSPPGFGKTLFAQVLAKACGVPLISTSVGSWFASGPGFLDSVVKEMRKSYAEAVARAAPVSIWHLDEIDALPDRAKLSTHALEWWNVLVSDALNLVDSALSRKDSDSLVVVVGTTNAIDRVDPALLRPGRLERAVEIEPPALDGVVNILRFHLDGELAGEDLAGVGALLQGSTPAEIMQAVRTARRAARHAGRPLLVGDLAAAALPPEAHPPLRLFRMAVHEAAHAVVALALSAGAVDHVFLKAEGHRRGTTRMRYRDDDLATRQAIEDRVVVALAARAAERLFTGSVSTGGGGAADSDIGVATLEVAALHASYGLRGAPIYLGAGEELQGAVAYDPALREAVGRDLRRLERRAGRLVAANRAAILAVARRLAERRHLTGAEIESIVRGRPRARRRGSSKTNP